jgi:hypothetical protein
MSSTLAVLLLSVVLPAEDPVRAQVQSGGGVESTVPGVPIADPKIVRERGKPPTIVYPPSRLSKKQIDVGDYLVGVDDGVEWQGKVAYYSLFQDLIVANATTGKTLWHARDSAFWDTVTFENLARPNDPPNWAVVLKSSGHPGFSQGYQLASGKRLALRGSPPQPSGTVLHPRKTWSGSAGVRREATAKVVGSAEEWSKLRKEVFVHKAQGIPEASEIDFGKEMLLALYLGETTNRNGLSPALVVESDARILVRVKVHSYQSVITSSSSIRAEHPYGLITLPRGPGKPLVLEYDDQIYIGGPEIWKEKERLTLAAGPVGEPKRER